MSEPGRKVLHIDCDCFFAAVEMREQPHLCDVPIAIGGESDRRGVIATCNYPARAFGVRSAMATATARRLCPDLVLLRGRMELYREVSAQVMNILRDYSPLLEQVSVDEAYLELDPDQQANQVAAEIRERVRHELGISVSVGGAPNKFLAKVASDWNKPDGQKMIPPQEVDEFVKALPVGRIPGIGPAFQARLKVLGIETCDDARSWDLNELVRRLTEINSSDQLNLVLIDSGTMAAPGDGATDRLTLLVPTADTFNNAYALGAVVGGPLWALEGAADGSDTNTVFDGNAVDKIPEIDIKVDSVSVTAVTKKLKAKWTPELGQDLNAYHNLDAEVELTSILSEQIALEIDREIVNDLVQGAKAGTYYWSRSPGLFVKKDTGAELGAASAAPDFTGTVSEWYETLVETINDVSAQIHRKTLRGGANFVIVSPEVANILEFTSGFRANVTADADKGSIGAVKAGSISRKWDVIVDPYFPRNVILVGRKGSSFLESGYVYAPYVPLQTTPTIFGVEDFVPRKGVMTRYAKKMVRPDMYGLVLVRGLLGESGAS